MENATNLFPESLIFSFIRKSKENRLNDPRESTLSLTDNIKRYCKILYIISRYLFFNVFTRRRVFTTLERNYRVMLYRNMKLVLIRGTVPTFS